MPATDTGPEILVMGQAAVHDYEPHPGEVCVSIYGRDIDTPPALRHGFAHILRLRFDDDTFPGWEYRGSGITGRQAAALARFVLEHRTAPRIVVHCFAGISRSQAVADAIALELYGRPIAHRILNLGVFARVALAIRTATLTPVPKTGADFGTTSSEPPEAAEGRPE